MYSHAIIIGYTQTTNDVMHFGFIAAVAISFTIAGLVKRRMSLKPKTSENNTEHNTLD